MNKLSLFFMLIFTLFLLTGCFDKTELENSSFVLAVGFDKDSVSLGFPEVSNDGGRSEESKGDKKDKNVLTAEGLNSAYCIDEIDVCLTGELDLSQAKVCVVGSDVLKDEKHFKEVIDYVERNNEISRRVIILAAEDKSSDILNAKSSQSEMPGLFAADFYNNNVKNTDYTFKKDLQEVITDILETGTTVIPQVYSKDDELKLEGAVVIKDYSLKGVLNDKETRCYTLFTQKDFGGFINTEKKGVNISAKVKDKKISSVISEDSDGLVINVKANIKGEIYENSKLYSDEYIQSILSEKVSEDIKDCFELFMKKFKIDAIGINELCEKKYTDIYSKYKDNWNEAFVKMKVNVETDFKITGSGSIKEMSV